MQEFTNTVLNNYFINLFLLVFAIATIICALFYKQIVGKAGEHHVKKELKKLPKDKYLVINDLMIKMDDLTHQIDHVVISSYGIFVIETKQYNGYIFGNEYDKKWKQNNKYYINNPIHQNYGHVKALEGILNISEDKFIPIVCIPSTAKIKVVSKNLVLGIYELIPEITKRTECIIEDYLDIYDELRIQNITDRKERKKHIRYVKSIKKNRELNETNKCPKCGGNLIKKNGKYGEFMGCSNYPKCGYTKNNKVKKKKY